MAPLKIIRIVKKKYSGIQKPYRLESGSAITGIYPNPARWLRPIEPQADSSFPETPMTAAFLGGDLTPGCQ
jgi:hypothetical protein